MNALLVSGSSFQTKPVLSEYEQNVRTAAMVATAQNTAAAAQNTAVMVQQMDQMLELNASQLFVQQEQLAVQYGQLAVQREQLGVQRDQLAVQQGQLYVQEQVRRLSAAQLKVGREQLVQALRTVARLDLANQRLAAIDSTLGDIAGQLAQQNALLQRSLNRLQTEAEELILRGLRAYNHSWLDDAAADLDRGLEKNPYAAVAHYYRAKLFAREGRATEAQRCYQKCILYARGNAPIFENLALCDLAVRAAEEGRTKEARQFLVLARACPEQDRAVVVAALLRCDQAEGALHPDTTAAVQAAFADEGVDPEVLLLKVLTEPLDRLPPGPFRDAVLREHEAWKQAARQAQYERTVSHFYRELDDFVYLAPRLRAGFMEDANRQFTALGLPLADLLDWTAAIGQELVKGIELFRAEHLPILALHRVLAAWNERLVNFNKLTALLAAKSDLMSGRFVSRLNLGLVDLPVKYEDDKVLFEVTTRENDTLALTCYYALFIRNGVEQFAVRLKDFPVLRVETYPAPQGSKGVLVVDPRTGQTLLQATAGTFRDAQQEEVSTVDLFLEAANLLARVHDQLDWVLAHEEELFSVFLLLQAVAHRLAAARLRGPARPADDDFEVVSAAPATPQAQDDFEVVEEQPAAPAPPAADDGFELVEEAPAKWFIARGNKKFGPAPWEQIQKLAAAGKLLRTDMLLKEGSARWVRADGVEGLSFKDK